MQWQELQSQFVRSMREPDMPVPEAIAKTGHAISVKRFNVYRNNSAVSLSEALAATFPVTVLLVGENFFHAMAAVFMQKQLPVSPVLMNYGESFPDFIRDFEPARSVPYLADMARLEWLWSRAYHAADAASETIEVLGAIPPEQLSDLRFEMHPSVQLMRAQWPVLSIWSAHNQENTDDLLQNIVHTAEYGLIIRPSLEVNVLSVPPEIFIFIESLLQGNSLGEAFERMATGDPEDLSGGLQLLFNNGVVLTVRQE